MFFVNYLALFCEQTLFRKISYFIRITITVVYQQLTVGYYQRCVVY